MTPTFAPLPPPAPPAPLPPPAAPVRTPGPTGPDDRRVPAAAWVAAVGASLVLVAAAVLVVGSWNRIAPEIKVAGLLAVDLAVAALAVALRRVLPVVGRALAHLAATLTVPAGVAVMAAAGQRWPAALLAGGGVGVAACVAQARRWRAPLLIPAAEAAGVLGLAGVAALADLPLGLLVAAAAGAAVVARHDAGAVRLAALAPLVPALAVLGALGVGPGTAARLGASGAVLAWGAPAAGALAAVVFGVVAARRRATPLAVAAMLAGLAGAVTGLAELRPDGVVVLALVGVALLLVAAVEDARAKERVAGADGSWAVWAPLIDVAAAVARTAVPAAGLLGLVALAASGGTDDAALGLAAAAWAAAAAALAGPQGEAARVAPPLGVLRVAATVAAGGAAAALGGSALVGLMVLAVVIAARGILGRPLRAERVALAVALVPFAWSTDPAGTTIAGLTAGLIAGLTAAAVALAAVALVVRRADAVAGDRPAARALGVLGVAAAAAVAIGPAWPADRWAPVAALAALVTVLAAGREWMLAAGVAPWLGLAVGVVTEASPTTLAVAAVVGAVALTGAAMTSERPGPLDVAAVSTAVVALQASTAVPGGALTSVAGVVLGAQGWLYGSLRRQRELAAFGGLVLAVSIGSLPFTTGLAAAVVDRLRPYGVDEVDLTVLAVAGALLAGGGALRRTGRAGHLGSWPAYAPGLVLGGLHLLTSQASTGQVGRVAVALAVGVVATAIGGLRRLGAPLVLGPSLIVASAVLAGGARLASLPVWLWLALGGAGLLVVAVLIERGGPADEAARPADRLRAAWHRFD